MSIFRVLVFGALAFVIFIIFEGRQQGYFGNAVGLILTLCSVSVWLYTDHKTSDHFDASKKKD